MLAIAGGKGGCGKTTTTLGVAVALGQRGRDVLAVDADVDMPNLHALAGVLRRSDQTPQATEFPGVSVRSSAPSVTLEAVTRTLQQVDRSRSVLVDCPAGAGPEAAAPLRIVDRTLLTTTVDRESLTDAAKTAAVADALDAPPIGVVLTRSDTDEDSHVVQRVADLLDCPVLASVPDVGPVDDVLAETPVEAAYRQLSMGID